jgi:hypothetical protein
MRLFIQLSMVMSLLLVGVNAGAVTVDLKLEPPSVQYPQHSLGVVKGLKGVRVLPFADRRKAGETVFGELRYSGDIQKLQSTMPVADFITAAFKKLHEEAGGKVSNDGPLTLRGDITQLYVDESEGGQARVGFHLFLADEGGKVLWDGHSSGIIRGGSRAMSPETVSGFLSDALRATYFEMLEDEKLTGVWSGRVSNTYVIR